MAKSRPQPSGPQGAALVPHMEFAGEQRCLDQLLVMRQLTIDKSKLQRQPLKGALQAMYGVAAKLS